MLARERRPSCRRRATDPPDADPLPLREAWREERRALLARASRAAPIFAPSSLERLETPDWGDGVGPALTVALAPAAGLAPAVALAPAAGLAAPLADLAAQTSGLAPTGAHLGAAVGATSGAAGLGLGRAHALALGTAVHFVLERVDLDDDAGLDGLAAQAAAQARLSDDAGRVATLARACWRAAPLRGAARSAHHRELAVCARHGDWLIEGAIDLIYRDDELGGWVVVDYKTDARLRPEAVRAQYGGQAGAYALAFEAAGGGRVVAVRVLLAALPDAAGAATVVDLPIDQGLRDLVESRLREGAAVTS